MDFKTLIENTINNTKLSDFWLCEGIKEYAKQFPKMSEQLFRELMKFDPTYKGGEQLGKYGNWIAQLYYNGIKNKERMDQYKRFMIQNNGINPKTGEEIKKPDMLPEVQAEDLEKIPNLLKQYETLKGQIKKPITMFKDVPELYSEIEKFKQNGMPTDKRALQRYKTFKECEKKGLKKIFENNEWIIGIPETLESSVPFGEYCNWCTTSAHGHYYNRYLENYGGQYYILLNKKNGDLFQFHFESNQFMDESDRQIDMYNFTNENRKIAEFLHQYKSSISEEDSSNKIEKTEQRFTEIIKDPSRIRNRLDIPYTTDIKVENNKIKGRFDLLDLGNIVYDDGRDDITLEAITGLLTEFYANYDFWHSDTIQDYSSFNSDWNSIAIEYDIGDFDWDRITSIYSYGFDDEDEDESLDVLNNKIINNLISNDYGRNIREVKGKLLMDEIINERDGIINPEKLKELLSSSHWNEKIDETTQEKIQEIIQDNFYDGYGLLSFLHICEEYGTEKDCINDITGVLKDNLPLSSNYFDNSDGRHILADFEISIEDFWKIFYVKENGWTKNIPSYKQEFQRELFKNQTETIREDWFQKWSNESSDEYSEEISNWIYLWRVFHDLTDFESGTEGAFAIREPSYGWNEFDDKYFEEGCRSAADKIAKLLGRSPKEQSKNK